MEEIISEPSQLRDPEYEDNLFAVLRIGCVSISVDTTGSK